MTRKFPVHAPRGRVIGALHALGFRVVGEGDYVAMMRDNVVGTRTPLTLPGHATIKGSTLPAICIQARIQRDDFLTAYYRETR